MLRLPLLSMDFSRQFGAVFAAALIALPLLSACSSTKDDYQERPVEELYNEAMDAVEGNEYLRGSSLFEDVERQHPYSVWATKAQLMGAYALYKRNKYDDAVVALDRFIQFHPGNRDVPYAYYLKALCYYEQITDVERDQKTTETAAKYLREVVDRFPNSAYARDAKLKLDLTQNHLAGKEMTIGRYYQKRGQWLAAINRYRAVLDHYQTTSQVPEALFRLVEVYTTLGMEAEAKNTAAVLGHNYPGSEWYEDAYTLLNEGTAKSAGEQSSWHGLW